MDPWGERAREEGRRLDSRFNNEVFISRGFGVLKMDGRSSNVSLEWGMHSSSSAAGSKIVDEVESRRERNF